MNFKNVVNLFITAKENKTSIYLKLFLFFAVSCPKNILKSLSEMLKKKKFELQIFFFWLTFCLPGNVVTGYLYNTSSLPAESNNQTEETCQTTDYPDNKQVSPHTTWAKNNKQGKKSW